MDGSRPIDGCWVKWSLMVAGVVACLLLLSPAQAFFPPIIQPPGPPVNPPPTNPPPVVVPPVDPPPVVVPPRQVPEPATMVTALAGLAAAAGYRAWRKRRTSQESSDGIIT
ncbi:MAG: PEP-CTERM sorting domain-containing protein [Gemmataceae bacterium]|nr:PEP-CTERM sorting domain-containing protein [Gemmataceae bacterium]